MSDLMKSLESLKIPHYECEDGWYSCPLSEEGCFNEAQGDECTCGASKRNEVIDKAIAALQDDGWVSVEDRLPVRGDRVLLCINNIVQYGTFYLAADGNFEPHWFVVAQEDCDPILLAKGQHWMPLPTPPKEGWGMGTELFDVDDLFDDISKLKTKLKAKDALLQEAVEVLEFVRERTEEKTMLLFLNKHIAKIKEAEK